MNAAVLAWLALSVAAPTLARADSLQVATAEPALGEEIARAARRYVNGTIELRSLSAVPADSKAAHERYLTVRQESAETPGQRWTLVLSLGPSHQVRRTLALRESPSRFDLAEAVAIGLPDMLARLAEQAPPPRALPPTMPPPAVGRLALASVPRLPPGPRLTPQPAQRLETKEHTTEQPKEQLPGPSPKPTPTPPPVNPALPPVPPTPPATAKAKEPPAAPAPVLLKPEPPAPALPRPRVPPLSIGLAAGGAVVLAAGIGTGTAALVSAQQVNTPVQQHFDRDLDSRGKALNTATIVLDCVGAAGLLGGGAWLLARALKARRSTTQVSLLPAGRTLVLMGSF